MECRVIGPELESYVFTTLAETGKGLIRTLSSAARAVHCCALQLCSVPAAVQLSLRTRLPLPRQLQEYSKQFGRRYLSGTHVLS